MAQQDKVQVIMAAQVAPTLAAAAAAMLALLARLARGDLVYLS
jgi:hypothetical protein